VTVAIAVVLAREYVAVIKSEKLSVDKKTKSSPGEVEASAWAVFITNAKFLVSLARVA
jgi:hypothetical protein